MMEFFDCYLVTQENVYKIVFSGRKSWTHLLYKVDRYIYKSNIWLFNVSLFAMDFYGSWWIVYFHLGRLCVKDCRFFSSQCSFICLTIDQLICFYKGLSRQSKFFDIRILLNICEYLRYFVFLLVIIIHSHHPLSTFCPQIFIRSCSIELDVLVGHRALDWQNLIRNARPLMA